MPVIHQNQGAATAEIVVTRSQSTVSFVTTVEFPVVLVTAKVGSVGKVFERGGHELGVSNCEQLRRRGGLYDYSFRKSEEPHS